jgi:hypothetical protein
MSVLSASDARSALYRLIDETLYLNLIPGMRDSIREGMKELLSKSAKKIPW